jgi:hypothetical protein
MVRGERRRLAAALFGALLLVGVEASARNETLQWTHADPSTVTGFRVYWRVDGSSTLNQFAPVLPPVSGNTYTYTAAGVPDTGGVWFSVRAYNAVGDSPSSNEICRGCGSTTPPPPPPPGTGAQSGISSLNLRDANTDSVLVANFTNQTITNGCTAIEIIGNAYLQSGGGSLSKRFDNGTPRCENTAPYAWEDDAGVGQFNCAASLQQNGSHTLVVTPYDGENCSGTVGTPVTVNFSVNISTTTPPPPDPIGTPGKPYLVQ